MEIYCVLNWVNEQNLIVRANTTTSIIVLLLHEEVGVDPAHKQRSWLVAWIVMVILVSAATFGISHLIY